MNSRKHKLFAMIFCFVLILPSVGIVFASSGAANASGGNTGAANGQAISGMTQLGGFNMYKISVYMGLTNKGGNDPKKYSINDFVKISSYYTTNGGAGGATNCRVFPASDKYKQFLSSTAPAFEGQPIMASFSGRYPSTIPVWRFPGESGQVNQTVIPYLKGVAASADVNSRQAFRNLQFYGVHNGLWEKGMVTSQDVYIKLISLYQNKFNLYDASGSKIDNRELTVADLSPAAETKNAETGKVERTAIVPWLLIVEPVYGMNVQGVAFAATASEAITMNIAAQAGGYTIPKQNTNNGFISGFISYIRQSLPASVYLEEDGWFQYSKFKKPPKSNMFYSWHNNTNQEVFNYGGYALLFSFPAEDKTNIEPIPIASSTSNKLEEDELLKGFRFAPPLSNGATFAHSYSLSSCPGYKWVGSGENRHKVNCGHAKTLANAKSITVTKVNVTPTNYWSAALFTDNTLIGKLKTFRAGTIKDDGVTAIFNQKGNFASPNIASVFKNEITSLNLMAARGGIAGNEAEIPQLAAYMNATKQNRDFNTFITPYVGAYPAKYSNPQSKMSEGIITTPLVIPGGSATATAKVTYCCGGSGTEIINGTISSLPTANQIAVDRSYEASGKTSSVIPASKAYDGVYGLQKEKEYGTMIHINVPSRPITFYPAYKMKYSTTNQNVAPTKDVWMLARGARTFNSNDYTNIECAKTKVQLSNPWSRDREDKFDKDGNLLKTPVAKSGTALKAYANDNVILVRTYIHVQDPAFAEDKITAQAYIDNIVAQYDTMAASINSAIPGNTSFYSNLWQSVTDATVHRVAVPTTIGNAPVQNLIDKSKLIPKPIKSNLYTATAVYYVDNDGKQDYDAVRSISIRGSNFPVYGQWNGAGINNSTKILNSLLETDKQVVKPIGWYDESYEGILVIARTYTIEISEITSDFVQIHPQLSDFNTRTNYLAKTVDFQPNPKLGPVIKGSDIYSYADSRFGVGIEYRLPNLTLGGYTFDNLLLLSAPAMFNIRGAVYDTK